MDEIRKAYAVLDLPRGASPDEVRKRYLALVRKWHPDRHTDDPVSQKEGSIRMRAINGAYRRLELHFKAAGEPAPTQEPRSRSASVEQRLTREEVERWVKAINAIEDDSQWDESRRWVWLFQDAFISLILAGLFVGAIHEGQIGEALLYLVLLALILGVRARERRSRG